MIMSSLPEEVEWLSVYDILCEEPISLSRGLLSNFLAPSVSE